MEFPTARDDVATDCTPEVPAPYRSWEAGSVVCPVPPFATERVPVREVIGATSVPKKALVDEAYIVEKPVVDAYANVTPDVVVRCCPVLNVNCVSPIPSAVTPMSSPVQVKAVPTTSEQSKMRSPDDMSSPSPTSSSNVSPPIVRVLAVRRPISAFVVEAVVKDE